MSGHVLFLHYGQESLAIKQLASVLRAAGHRVSLGYDPGLFADAYYLNAPQLARHFSREDALVDQAERSAPDLIAFSVLSPLFPWATRLAARCRSRTGAPVVFGGPHATAEPELCLTTGGADYVVRGEGEGALVELVATLAAGERTPAIANLSYRRSGEIVHHPARPLLADLDALPLPDLEIFAPHIDYRRAYRLSTSRGCPFHCAFCCTHLADDAAGARRYRVRWLSLDRIFAEMVAARERFGSRFFEFEDDVFTLDRDRVRAFADRYRREIGQPFQCLTHPGLVDREIAEALRAAGCIKLQLGVQSLHEPVRTQVLRRRESIADVLSALDACAAAGLRVGVDHMLDVPGETAADLHAAAELYSRFDNIGQIRPCFLTFLPGARALEEAAAHKLLAVDEVAAIRQGRIKNFFSRAEAVGYPRTSRAEATQFRLLFRLLPVLPPTLRRAVVALRLYQPLGHLPPALAQLAEMVLGALSSERKASLYGAQLRHDLRRGLRDWLVTAHQRPSHADVEVAPASARPARRLLVGLRRLRQPADRRGENDRT